MRHARRFVAALMVMAIMVTALFVPVVSVADDDVISRREYYAKTRDDTADLLRSMVEVYEETPEDFDADWIYMAHTYFVIYEAVVKTELAESIWELAVASGKTMFRDSSVDIPGQEKLQQYVDQKIAESYGAWLDGEKSDSEYAAELVSLIKALALKDK